MKDGVTKCIHKIFFTRRENENESNVNLDLSLVNYASLTDIHQDRNINLNSHVDATDPINQRIVEGDDTKTYTMSGIIQILICFYQIHQLITIS